MPRILTPATHSEETLEIARDLLPPGFDLVMAPHGRPEFFDLLKDTEYYIGAGPIPPRCGILPEGAKAADRADPERRLQHL